MRALAALIAGVVLQPGWVSAQDAPALPCGNAVTIERGDTLSRIAERCNLTEAAILRANPRIQGSGDLQARTTLQLRPSSGDAGVNLDQAASRLGAIASGVGNTLSDIAGQVGTTAEDLLSRNPDLQDRLRQLRNRLGTPNVEAGAAAVSISPRSGPVGAAVTVSARGLPANTPLVVGGGQRGAAYEVLDSVRTGGDGTAQAMVRVPDWAGTTGQFVFVVASLDPSVTARSEPFLVTGPANPARP